MTSIEYLAFVCEIGPVLSHIHANITSSFKEKHRKSIKIKREKIMEITEKGTNTSQGDLCCCCPALASLPLPAASWPLFLASPPRLFAPSYARVEKMFINTIKQKQLTKLDTSDQTLNRRRPRAHVVADYLFLK